ncbi:hypothetical protein RRG08_064961 [Elysia crispata]|uniref:Uncharacterized protein n=1 Tax=Elysia crispata TaxID=231223 RepID=A0AAE1DUF4_9GAST|nr:hypothetical protein RRG08_064961 [Elysia crispata]
MLKGTTRWLNWSEGGVQHVMSSSRTISDIMDGLFLNTQKRVKSYTRIHKLKLAETQNDVLRLSLSLRDDSVHSSLQDVKSLSEDRVQDIIGLSNDSDDLGSSGPYRNVPYRHVGNLRDTFTVPSPSAISYANVDNMSSVSLNCQNKKVVKQAYHNAELN